MKRSMGFFAQCGWLTSGSARLDRLDVGPVRRGLGSRLRGVGARAFAASRARCLRRAATCAAHRARVAFAAVGVAAVVGRRRGIGPLGALIDPGADQGELLRGQRVFLERHLVFVRDRAGGTEEALHEQRVGALARGRSPDQRRRLSASARACGDGAGRGPFSGRDTRSTSAGGSAGYRGRSRLARSAPSAAAVRTLEPQPRSSPWRTRSRTGRRPAISRVRIACGALTAWGRYANLTPIPLSLDTQASQSTRSPARRAL